MFGRKDAAEPTWSQVFCFSPYQRNSIESIVMICVKLGSLVVNGLSEGRTESKYNLLRSVNPSNGQEVGMNIKLEVYIGRSKKDVQGRRPMKAYCC